MFRHRNFQIWLDKSSVNAPSYEEDSSFIIIPGLAGKGITFKSLNYPNRFIRHRGWLCFIDKNDGSKLFKLDASFTPVRGLTGAKGSVSFESVNYPGYYMRHAGFRVRLNKNNNSPLFKKDATWIPTSGMYTCQAYRTLSICIHTQWKLFILLILSYLEKAVIFLQVCL